MRLAFRARRRSRRPVLPSDRERPFASVEPDRHLLQPASKGKTGQRVTGCIGQPKDYHLQRLACRHAAP